jgi:hypothetical protein
MAPTEAKNSPKTTNQTGIAIVIKAFLPTGKSLDESHAALSLVKDAHATGNYSTLLAQAKVEEVKTEMKTRRVETPVLTVVHAAPEDDAA